MKVVAVSDTHNKVFSQHVPKCDLFIHCGDLTQSGIHAEIQNALSQIERVDARYKVVTPGNHDFAIEKEGEYYQKLFLKSGVHLLVDESVMVEGVKIHMSPWTPTFGNWAFMRSSAALDNKWQEIDDDCDIVVTHGPAYGCLDMTERGERVGCKALDQRIREKNPKYHLFGHIHEDYGNTFGVSPEGSTVYANCSYCKKNVRSKGFNKPLVFDV